MTNQKSEIRSSAVSETMALLTGSSNSLKNLHKQGSDLKKTATAVTFDLVTKSDSYSIDPYAVVEDAGYNPRGGGVMTEEEYFSQPSVIDYIMGIARAYARGDYVEPIRIQVINNVPHLRQGAHRLRGVKIAIEELNAEIRRIQVLESQGDQAQQDLQQLTGNMGKDFSPLSKAVLYERFVAQWGWTEDELADKLNVSKQHVTQTRRLLELPLAVRRMIMNEQVTATEAMSQYNKHGSKVEEVLLASLDQAQKSGKTKITAKHIVSENKAPRVPKKVATQVMSSFSTLSKFFDTATETEAGVQVTMQMTREEFAELQDLKDALLKLTQPQVAGTDATDDAEELSLGSEDMATMKGLDELLTANAA